MFLKIQSGGHSHSHSRDNCFQPIESVPSPNKLSKKKDIIRKVERQPTE
jgi:hypothetical protein